MCFAISDTVHDPDTYWGAVRTLHIVARCAPYISLRGAHPYRLSIRGGIYYLSDGCHDSTLP
ncbi:hypothetical protein E5S67_01046 [Microcoleus sp. IPMA8]|uniref:Uncharacterized protein n=1 Tax=Microcoleus asticus IPMA8 TaxID=2563858 RepID=A0ABX2CSF6_9CYAN|nr:hypothetical protein [Microcoleus asticus IPMA8]